MKTYTKLLCIAALLLVVAFKPWGKVNQTVGLRSVSDSLEVALKESDSLLVSQATVLPETPVKVVLPKEEISTLVEQVKQQDSEIKALTEKKKKQDAQIAQLRKSVTQKQETIVSLKEIEGLLTKQNKKNASPDEESDLEKSLNAREGKPKPQP